MKILFVLEHFHPYIGGAEKLFYELTTNLAKNGIEVIVVTTRFDDNLPLEEIHQNIKIVRVKCFNRFGFTFLSLPKIIKNAKGCNFIHTTTYNAALPAILAGKLLSKPVFVTFHEVWGRLWKNLPFISRVEKNAFYLFEKMLLRMPFHTFIAVSEFTKAKLIEYGVPNHKVKRIYNGIDYSQFSGEEPNESDVFTYTYFGRLGVSKGLDVLIPAATEFKKSYPDSIFKLIIPKQPQNMYTKIMNLIATHDLTSHIEMHHDLTYEQLNKELLSSSCIVIPSYSEGFCFAAAETVAHKLPIISSKKGALKEVVSGKFINLDELNSTALRTALVDAYHNRWTETPIRYFHLSDSVDRYQELYSQANTK